MRGNGWFFISIYFTRLVLIISGLLNFFLGINSIIELRRLEKEEEKRAREKIRQKLEEDKVSYLSISSSGIFMCC